MNRLKAFVNRIPWLAYALAAAGAAWYGFQTWTLSRTLTTMILDESMYVYKGWLFVSGKFAAYQDYGPLTNHMPLSFIIPGVMQRLFGPGMEAARVFAFITGLVMLAGFWLAFYRLGGKWWGAFIVWMLALSPAWQIVFSQGLTQGLVNTFIAWGFVMLIGEKRETRDLAIAGALFALAVMTRINTLPILVLMVIYVFWQHGWREGLAAAAGGLAVTAITLGFFWPDVLKFISGWIPEGWLAYVDPYRSPWSQQHVPEGFSYRPVMDWIGHPDSLQWDGLHALAEAINFNLVPFLVVTATILLWPRRKEWVDSHRQRLSAMLVTSWLVMAGMHIWVALSGTSCPFYCLAGYFPFFNLTALLLLPASSAEWRRDPPIRRGVLGMVLLFGMGTAALFAAGYRYRWMYQQWYRLMHSEIPRMADGQIYWEESGLLLSLLEAKLNVDYAFLVEVLPNYVYWVLPVVGIFVLIPLIHFMVLGNRRYYTSVFWVGMVIFLFLGVALGPTKVFTYEAPVIACEDDVIASHEETAEELAELIEPGSLVFHNLTSNMLLLYLPEIEIFPPQLNTGFNFVNISDPADSEEIYRAGYWNEDLKQTWLDEADVLLITNQRAYNWEDVLNSPQWEQIGEVGPYESCRADKTVIYVLERATP